MNLRTGTKLLEQLARPRIEPATADDQLRDISADLLDALVIVRTIEAAIGKPILVTDSEFSEIPDGKPRAAYVQTSDGFNRLTREALIEQAYEAMRGAPSPTPARDDEPGDPQPDAKRPDDLPLDTGGPAFPTTSPLIPRSPEPGFTNLHEYGPDPQPGMTLREHAAIALRVPRSGRAWLDDMIREARLNESARAALREIMRYFAENQKIMGGAGPTSKDGENFIAVYCYRQADALVAEGEAQSK